MWGVPCWYYAAGRTSPDPWFVHLFLLLRCYLFSSVVSGTPWEFDNEARRRDVIDRRRDAVHQVDDATRERTRRPSSAAYTRVRRRPVQANAVAGPSTQPGNGGGSVQNRDVPGASQAVMVMSPTQQEIDLLVRLANGSGLSHYDTLGFMEMCTRCGYFFLGSFLCRHITSCMHKK